MGCKGVDALYVLNNAFIFTVLFLRFSHAQDRGAIFIGNSTTDLATEYTYSFTQRGSPQNVPIFATVFANGNPASTVAKTEDITISCSVLDTGTGFSTLSISDASLLAADDTGTISFLPQTVGRTVSVQCSARSTTGTCPIGTGSAQFCPQTSLSNVVSVKILPAATITQCKLANSVIIGNSTFAVRLSEPALTQVTVSCTTQGTLASSLDIFSLALAVGRTNGEVSFTVRRGIAGDSAQVTCTAQSASGSQFSNSQVDASTALFTLRDITLSFEPSNVRVYNTTVTSFLILSDPSTVNVACRAYTVSSLEAAVNAAAPNCADIDSQTSTETTPWRVETVFFEMTADSGAAADMKYFKAVTTSRVQPVTQAVTEVVLTRCCVRTNSADDRFRGLHATMITVAQLAPFVCEQCNTTVEDAKSERILQNPGYVDLAPCPCDLIENSCDFNCCCDEECSANQRARFSECIAGLPGGEPAKPEEYRCSSNAFNLPDWHLMTCVFYESNAYLGMYYMNKARVAETDFSDVVSSQYKGSFSFSKPESESEVQTTAYSHGVTLTTLREDVAVGPRSTGTLALPRPGSDGACDFLSPVKFLVDQQASCTSTLLPDTCSDLSRFSGRIYVASSDITGCSQSFKVTSTLSGDTVTPTDVRYHCATDLSPYNTTTTATALNALPANQVSEFGPDLVNENCDTPCSSQACLNYNSGRDSTVNLALPPLCSWDDGSTPPRVPDLSTNGVCSNVVLDVRYTFEWSGSQITGLTANVILGDVSNVVQGAGVQLTQRFQANWIHKTNGTVYTLSDNYASTTEAYQRSGSAGYDDGAPLFSGCAMYNQTTQEFQGVDTNSERQMAVWRPGVDGLCENARRQTLTFADDTFSSCALRLTVNDLETRCDELRQTISNHLNVLMPSSFLGRYGYNNEQDLTMWIPVLRQVLNFTEESSVPPVATGTEPFRTWADSITGVCRVPSSINLNVMYSQAGAVNGQPRREIVGAYISYTLARWSMDCQGANAARCDATSGLTQNFLLSSSVQFTKVDTSSQTSKTRFHTRCDPYDFAGSSSCERFFSNIYREECYWETCWQELAYPVRPAAEKGPKYNWRLQALPVFLALVLGIVGYVSVAKPGWS